MHSETVVALTIAGSDPSGGAGIQADLKTFQQFQVYGEAVITLITVQNTTCVQRIHVLPPDLIEEQIRAVLTDIPPAAAKAGALGDAATIQMLARVAVEFPFPLVIDPVMVSKHGVALMPPEEVTTFCTALLPRTFLLTPNLLEASMLTSMQITDRDSMRRGAERLVEAGARNVLIKGGHLEDAALDILLHDGEWFEYPAARLNSRHTHGTGCTLSAAITACLAMGLALPDAVGRAKRFVHEAIRTAPGLGRGSGPLNHHVACEPRPR